MQTFLPYPDFQQSMACLDDKRLGNQVYRECLTLLHGGWPNHPASKMWRGYEIALAYYGLCGLEELRKRGRYYPQHYDTFEKFLIKDADIIMPFWLGNDIFHSSHRAALLVKNYEHYKQFNWIEKPVIDYYWPI